LRRFRMVGSISRRRYGLESHLSSKNEGVLSISCHPKYNGRNPAELDLPAARGRNLHDGWIVRAGGSRAGHRERLLKRL
jgi:hypothetical protein